LTLIFTYGPTKVFESVTKGAISPGSPLNWT